MAKQLQGRDKAGHTVQIITLTCVFTGFATS